MGDRLKAILLFLPAAFLLLQCASSATGAAGAAGASGDGGSGSSGALSPGAGAASQAPAGSAAEGPEDREERPSIDVSSPVVVLDALVQAYPDRVTDLAIRNGDWSVLIDGRAFHWAGGRMLSAEELDRSDSYSPYSFRPYPEDVQPVPDLSPEDVARLKARINQREAGLDGRSPAFLIAMWGMATFADAEVQVRPQRFLGRNIRVNPRISGFLEAVEADILAAAETDPETAAWLETLGPIGAYVWRDIAGSANRSLHSFGIAVDIQPRSYGGKQAYWRWAADYYDAWWSVPLEDRYRPPAAVIEAFERHGFTWGGKWFLYDQIHFEYRPELHVLAARTASDRRGDR